MNTATNDKDINVLEVYEHAGYDYMTRFFDRWKGRVYFTDQAKARMGVILGYIIGLKHAGQVEMAEKLAEDIEQRLNQLAPTENQFEIVTEKLGEEGEEPEQVITKVPLRKCVIADDGTWHSFALRWFSLLNPDVYDEHVKLAQEAIEVESETGEVFDTAHQRVVKQLNILERVDPNAPYSEELTVYRYIDGMHRKFYYVPGYNGGLVYHGPGHGETFTVNTGGSGTLWGIHT